MNGIKLSDKRWLIIIFASLSIVLSDKFSDLNLPENHLQYYFHSFPNEAAKCQNNSMCMYKKYLNKDVCWGYEPECTPEKAFSVPRCLGDHKGWVKTKRAQIDTFYAQSDFGYVRDQRSEMRIFCEPQYLEDSSLECSEHMRFCRGRNIMINFTHLADIKDPIRYNMEVLRDGKIGGYCKLNKQRLEDNADHISPLQSWGPELRYFQELPRRPRIEGDCDTIIDKPTFILKIDATVNMYHHFCDFFNLYASLHVNLSHPTAFSTDSHIMIWESYRYRSAFEDTFEAFTRYPIWNLKTFQGKTVCFKNVVLPLLPRMLFGLYYNTPLIHGCEGSGLFAAFSDHLLHRMKIPLHKRANSKIRVTFLSRDTQFRRVLNENELVESLKLNPNYEVQMVTYNRYMPFKQQLEVTRNSDIFIGIHGAGLTHFMFLPNWAAGFELYNCEDSGCYKDIARLRGIKYFTWKNINKLTPHKVTNHRSGGAHEKFINYSFDVAEFLKIVSRAEKYVKSHEDFQNFIGNVDHKKEQRPENDEL